MVFRVLPALLCLAAPLWSQPASLQRQTGDGSVALLGRGQIIWQFQYAATLPKPIFHPVSLQGGPVLTVDAPADHRWHHGFWFAWKYINGLN